jgi:hypothetical protein
MNNKHNKQHKQTAQTRARKYANKQKATKIHKEGNHATHKTTEGWTQTILQGQTQRKKKENQTKDIKAWRHKR